MKLLIKKDMYFRSEKNILEVIICRVEKETFSSSVFRKYQGKRNEDSRIPDNSDIIVFQSQTCREGDIENTDIHI